MGQGFNLSWESTCWEKKTFASTFHSRVSYKAQSFKSRPLILILKKHMKLETGYHLPKFGWTGKNNVWKLPMLIIWKRFFYLLINTAHRHIAYSGSHHIYIYISMWLLSLHAMIQTSTVCNLKWICMCVWRNYNFQFHFGAVVTNSSMNCSTTVTKASLLWKRRSKITSMGRFLPKAEAKQLVWLWSLHSLPFFMTTNISLILHLKDCVDTQIIPPH